MKNYILILISLFMAFEAGAQNLNLDELINKAKNHSPQQAQLSLIKEATALQTKLLSGANLPQASLGGQATWQSEVTSISIPLPNIDIQPPPKDQYKITLDLQQNIWDGGLNKSQKSMAKAAQKVEENKVATDLFKTEEMVVNLFFGALFADKQKTNLTLLSKELDSKIKQVNAAIENGIAIKSNLLVLQAKKLELEQSLAEIAQKKSAAMKAIGLLSGETYSAESTLLAPNYGFDESQKNQRPELELLAAEQASIMASESLVRAKNKPKLGLFVTGGYGRPGLNFLARDFSPYAIGGVMLKVPLSHLYTGAQTTEIQQLKIKQQRIEKQKEGFLLAAEVQLANANAELERLATLIITDKKLITIREQIRATADAQLSNGVITASDYLTELNNEDLAKQALVLHEVQLLQAKQNLKLILGL